LGALALNSVSAAEQSNQLAVPAGRGADGLG
jgi:hypothetical protein